MLKHAKQSVKAASADTTQVDGPAWNDDHVIDADGATMATRVDAPAAPAAGKAVLFGRATAGLVRPALVGPDGRASVMQASIGQRRLLWYQPLANVASGSLGVMGGAFSSLGTATARAIATTNLFTLTSRQGFITNATANQRSAIYFNNNFYVRGTTAGVGGFLAFFRFGISDPALVSTANMFVGMVAASSMLNAAEPSAAVNIFGVGHDSTDNQLQLYTNDGTGTATKTALGANFPINTQNVDVYELALYCAPNDTKIGWQVTRLNTGDVANGSVTTDLPVNTQGIYPGFFRGNMGTALGVGIDVMSLYVESEV